MKAFCIFDDFPEECIKKLKEAGIAVKAIEKGNARPSEDEMKCILEEYEIVIIGTSQKIQEWMWENVSTPRIVATASVGIDHIRVPEEKKHLLTIVNTVAANTQSVAEYTVGAMLMARKRFMEGNALYAEGKNNKSLIRKPEDIYGSVIGLVGAGHISTRIIELLQPFEVKILCYTKHPENHVDLSEKYGVAFVSLDCLAAESNIISVNVPSDHSTENLINAKLIERMKEDCIFISVSRSQVVNSKVLIEKAKQCLNFYLILDLDILPNYVKENNNRNIIFTPHIAGGTIETRRRMFKEVTNSLIASIQ